MRQAMASLSKNLLLQAPGNRAGWRTFSAKPPQQTVLSAKKHLTETTWYSPLHFCDKPQNWFHELQEVAPGEKRASCCTAYKPDSLKHPHMFSQHMHTLPLEKVAAQ